MPHQKCEKLRKKWHIIAEGDNVPPPIKSFTVSLQTCPTACVRVFSS